MKRILNFFLSIFLLKDPFIRNPSPPANQGHLITGSSSSYHNLSIFNMLITINHVSIRSFHDPLTHETHFSTFLNLLMELFFFFFFFFLSSFGQNYFEPFKPQAEDFMCFIIILGTPFSITSDVARKDGVLGATVPGKID
jgi:hypothetical protein